MPDTITTDVSAPEGDIDSAADALLKKWSKPEPEGAKDTPATTQEETPNEEVEDETSETPEAEEGEETSEETTPKTVAADDHEVEVEVDGTKHRVAVKDLKRLFGQEASLTQKSQEVAALRAQAEEGHVRYNTALKDMTDRAKAAWEPYSKIDFMVAQTQLTPEEFAQLRAQAQGAYTNVQYFEKELDASLAKAAETNQAAIQEAAQKCVAELTDPETGIKGWNDDVYNELRTYSVKAGLPQHIVDTIVEPAAIKLLHKAMLFDKGNTAAVKKLIAAPKNVNKTPTNGGNTSSADARARKSLDALKRSGSTEDAAEALMARWASAE